MYTGHIIHVNFFAFCDMIMTGNFVEAWGRIANRNLIVIRMVVDRLRRVPESAL